ncbi:MAG: YceI family protein [Kangiellaceae bacterium]|nr:YceI family protein [Kangiellaceae bacterium]
MKKTVLTLLTASIFSLGSAADTYKLDIKGAHSFIQFTASHLGFSKLLGRFNNFDGEFTYDPKNIGASTVNVTIDTQSIDSNHAERDKHLRSDDFLSAGKFPKATFKSTKVTDKGDGTFTITGDFTLHGITKSVSIDAKKIGEGKDPWGGYRAGFEGTTKIGMGDFGFKNAWGDVVVDLYVEGIKQ